MANQQVVLVVEDEPAIAHMLEIAVEQAGFEPCVTETAEEALDTQEARHPDLIVTDVRLPGMDGVELTRRIRAEGDGNRDVPVLLISAYGEPGGHLADDFMAKPLEIEDFIERLHSLIDRKN